MAMYTAHDVKTGENYRFRSMDALARRLGGDGWNVEHDDNFNLPRRRVEITRTDRRQISARHIICRVTVPAEAVMAIPDEQPTVEEAVEVPDVRPPTCRCGYPASSQQDLGDHLMATMHVSDGSHHGER